VDSNKWKKGANNLIEEILISGLILTGLYSLLSFGFALITGVARVFNLAHGSLYMLCAYFIYYLSFMGLGTSIVISLILTIIAGAIIYQFFINPLKKKNFSAAVVTLSLALFIQALVSIVCGPQHKSLPYVINGYSIILGVRVVHQKLLTLIVSLILVVLLELFINRTRIGKSIKAVAQNMDVAKLVGINTRNTFMISMGISALLAGIAAVLFAPVYSVWPTSWTILFRIFPVMVLGGLGSLKGALVGSFVIAFTEKIIDFTIGGGYLSETVTFAIMLIIILVRPNGIFGKELER
jgi:branched-chain amino acid transport system permease protein